MAKTSMIIRDQKRAKLSAKYAEFGKLKLNCKSCHETLAKHVFNADAKSPADHTACIANLVSAEIRFGKPPCVVIFLV
jgi:hypothetical protein